MKNIVEVIEEIYQRVDFETEEEGEHAYKLAKVLIKEWALEMVGKDFPDSDVIAEAEDRTSYRFRLTHNITLGQIRKRIKDSTKTEGGG